MNDDQTLRLRRLIARPGEPLLLPGAPNAITARIIEDLGFDAVYLSGAGIANSYLGAPDIGLLSLPEIVGHVSATRDAVGLPIVVDGDTGFGNAINMQRTVRLFERAGASGIQIEDQVAPKRCGHFSGKAVISAEEMIGKVKAATDARVDDNFVIIARTDSRAVLGFDEACDRAARYLDAGADVAFIEAPRSVDELRSIPARVPGPHLVNMVEGGLTPITPLAELGEFGFNIVLYANMAMRAAMTGMQSALSHLLNAGDSIAINERIASWQERQRLVRKSVFDELGITYGNDMEENYE
ncbi:oxaloacetate decarboxylase [Parafrigoribacterium mesophilum]|uniref:isocitrate lyase/PEP mutase family protein n=1 Tax=Parafrigoribacterium mesophilum TaxID=433646 RepID=UPI0031FDF498